MTKLEYGAEALESGLGLLLVIKLLVLRLHATYKFFSFYLVCQLAGSSLWLFQRGLDHDAARLDYRVIWVAQQVTLCILIVVTVYTLLGTVLSKLPGILRLSQRYLNFTFSAAFAVGTLGIAWESHRLGYLNQGSWQANLVFAGIMLDRAVSIAVLLSVLAILGFLLWFPVKTARNLAVFIVGFSVYAMGSSFSLLFPGSIAYDRSRWLSTSLQLVTSACYAYWLLYISTGGESVPAQLNVRRGPEEQDRLLRTLEQLNDSVLRSARR